MLFAEFWEAFFGVMAIVVPALCGVGLAWIDLRKKLIDQAKKLNGGIDELVKTARREGKAHGRKQQKATKPRNRTRKPPGA